MPGTYRLRFEHEGFVTFEKEVVIAAGKPLRASASLTAAPPPPEPPKPEAPPPPPPVKADGSYSAEHALDCLISSRATTSAAHR